MIVELNEINTNTEEGRLLLAAIAKITTSTATDKTPNQVIGQLHKLVAHMFSGEPISMLKTGGGDVTIDSLKA